MKKIMILAAAIGAFAAPAIAQVSFSVSPEAGVNLANIHQRYKNLTSNGEKNDNGGIKVGVKAGANVDIWFADRLSI